MCFEVDYGVHEEAGQNTVMDLTYPQEAEDFRVEISGWLKDNLPKDGSSQASH